MTNPNNAIGTNGAYGGRTSVNAFNDNLAIYKGRGVLSGFVVSPNAGMSVAIGGDGTTRDVAIAEDNIGNKTTINNISESPISLTIAGAPVSNSRIDAIVAYVDNPAQGSATETDNPGACGLIAVQGTVAPTPSEPDENAVRTAITADGASGTTAYFVVLGYITIANGTTDITADMIEQGENAHLQDDFVGTDSVQDSAITSGKIDWTTLGTTTASLTADTNVNVASAYTFVPIDDLTLTPSDAPAGARFLVDVSLALKAPAGTGRDRYIRVIYNGQNYGGCGVNSDAGDWVCVSALALIPYNGSGSIEIQIAGSSTGTYQILSRSTAVAFRV